MSDLQFLGAWHTLLTCAGASLLAGAAFWLYQRQLRRTDLGPARWILPTLRALAIAIITLTLAEPTIQWRTRDGELARVTFLLDASQSMSIAAGQSAVPLAATAHSSPLNRYERGTNLLRGPSGYLSQLKDQFDVSVIRFDQQAGVELWNSRTGPAADSEAVAYDWSPAVWGEGTAIGDALQVFASTTTLQSTDLQTSTTGNSARNSQGNSSDATSRATSAAGDVVVLLSDGRSNRGLDPLAVAEQLGDQQIKVFTLGFGPFDETRDLAVRQLALPERLYRTDILSGTITLAQHLSQGTGFTLQLEHHTDIVWQLALTATDESQREVPFSLAVAPLFDRALSQLPAGTEIANLPIKLTARLIVDGGEDNELNNAGDGYTMIASQKSRLLLLDGRSRWESRYLKNMFTRDPSWQVDTVILSHAGEATQPATNDLPNAADGSPPSRVPGSKEELFEFDLIIVGEVEAFSLPKEFWQWLREYVELAGGGLIIIDGAREHLRDTRFESLHGLFPISWEESQRPRELSSRVRLTRRPQLTLAGQALDALRLSTEGAAASSQLWAQLPPLEFVARVAPLPGAEVLVEAVNEVDRYPLLVTRRYGAGRVLYSASDETWRWRYQVAELLHSRLWLQLARWTMKAPLSLRGEYLSLDSGAASYSPGQTINVRCQLRGIDGRPASGISANAIVTSNERIVSTWPLVEESVEGTYSALLRDLPVGDYQVRVTAPNFSTQALQLHSEFSIVAAPSQEMQRLSCDEQTLSTLAKQTSGKYLRESQAADLIELLQPLVRGRIRSSAMLLWQSYWWFIAAMLLLIAEWIVRKRVGLV